MPPATPAALAGKVSQPAPAPAPAPARAQVRTAAAGGIPAGVPGPWGADIARQPPAIDRTITGSIRTASPAHPPGFFGKLGDFAQRYGPQVAGSLIAGPVGGFLGGLVGRSFNEAKPGQLLGNPFAGLGRTMKGLGMFQSGTPYAGPISNYGTGLKAIGNVLGGNAPVGSRAYSRSTPGYSVTSLPGGTIQRTNQYGFTSFERPSNGADRIVFPRRIQRWLWLWRRNSERQIDRRQDIGRQVGQRQQGRQKIGSVRKRRILSHASFFLEHYGSSEHRHSDRHHPQWCLR